jgi:hypothetical protein
MAARRKYLFHPDEARKKIRASMLINRLHDHALAEKPLMDSSQIQAANILLKKAIPDLTSTEISGNADKPVEHKLKIEFIRPGE